MVSFEKKRCRRRTYFQDFFGVRVVFAGLAQYLMCASQLFNPVLCGEGVSDFGLVSPEDLIAFNCDMYRYFYLFIYFSTHLL